MTTRAETAFTTKVVIITTTILVLRVSENEKLPGSDGKNNNVACKARPRKGCAMQSDEPTV